MNDNNRGEQNQNQGRGWFGDSADHARAGQKGGRARGKNQRESRESGQKENKNEGSVSSDQI